MLQPLFSRELVKTVVIPLRVSFEWDTESLLAWILCDIFVVDIIMAVDIILKSNFFIAKKQGQEELLSTSKEIRQQYARTWMWWDVVASIPFELIAFGTGTASLAWLRIPKLARMARAFWHFNQIIGLLEERKIKVNAGILRLVQVFLCILFSGHWFGCIWHLIGVSEKVWLT